MVISPLVSEAVDYVHVQTRASLPQEDTLRQRAGSWLANEVFSFDPVVVGDVLGKYELVALIGRGSTSLVFLGRHLKLLFPVAVKVLEPAALADSPRLVKQLESEAILLAKLNHPNIVRLWDLEDEGAVPYLVMEHVAGGTLADLIQQKGPLPMPFAWAVIRQAVEGLAEAQKHGIIHRDVKPGNLLLGSDGHVKVADLGLAMVKNEHHRRHAPADRRGMMPCGTAAYICPEQAINENSSDFRGDIYSLGATLYHALTGKLVFEGRSPVEVIMKHVRQAPVDPRQLVPDLPQECAEVVLRMLSKKPEERFNSYEELRMALAQAIGDRRAPRPLAEAFLNFARSN